VATLFPANQMNEITPIKPQSLDRFTNREEAAYAIWNVALQRVVDLGYFADNPAGSQSRSVSSLRLGATTLFVIALSLLQVRLDDELQRIFGPIIIIAIGGFLALLIKLVMKKYAPRLTPVGVAVRQHLLGFKKYAEQVVWPPVHSLQQPSNISASPVADHPDLMQLNFSEALLPYALIYKLDQEWQSCLWPIFTYSDVNSSKPMAVPAQPDPVTLMQRRGQDFQLFLQAIEQPNPEKAS